MHIAISANQPQEVKESVVVYESKAVEGKEDHENTMIFFDNFLSILTIVKFKYTERGSNR